MPTFSFQPRGMHFPEEPKEGRKPGPRAPACTSESLMCRDNRDWPHQGGTRPPGTIFDQGNPFAKPYPNQPAQPIYLPLPLQRRITVPWSRLGHPEKSSEGNLNGASDPQDGSCENFSLYSAMIC